MAPASIDLTRLELQERADLVVDAGASQRFGVYAVASDHRAAELGRHLERVVFREVFGNPADLLAAEYGPYEDASLFVVVIDHRVRTPAGAMRIIVDSPAGFKSLHDLEKDWGATPEDAFSAAGVTPSPRHLWDVATLAVASAYRGAATGGIVSLALYQALASAAVPCDVHWWVAILDLVVLDLIQTRTYRPFSMFDGVEPRSYLDSPLSVPVWSDVRRWARAIARADRPMHALLCEGHGIESEVAPVDWVAARSSIRLMSEDVTGG